MPNLARPIALAACSKSELDILAINHITVGAIRGQFRIAYNRYLYLIVDIFSRKIVGWEAHEREAAELAATLIRKAVWSEACISQPLVLHADNGSPMKGATMKVTLEKLGS